MTQPLEVTPQAQGNILICKAELILSLSKGEARQDMLILYAKRVSKRFTPHVILRQAQYDMGRQ